jgi:hypothetical protein
MGREIGCPKCGAGHQIANPGITMIVCGSCHAVMYWQGDGQLQLGTESILPANQSRLFLFASGTLDGVGYQVVGHLRYDYGRGNWDEWYLQTTDGRVLWVSEDERVITEEVPIAADGAPPYQSLAVGTPVTLGGVTYTVRELATATCLGGEGQLPFSVFAGDSYAYADLATDDGTGFATLEYHADGVEAYAGRIVGHDRLTIEGQPPPATSRQQAEGINCTNCGANLSTPDNREVTTKVCEYCGTQLDMTSEQHAILGHNEQGYQPGFVFEVGQPCTFHGDRYEVAGRTVFTDPEGYLSREYLLFNPGKGYLWLAEYQGHYTLLSEAHARPKQFSYYAKASTEVAGNHYRVYEWGAESIKYVDGALPWKAHVGQTHNTCTLIAPPQVYEIETDGNEEEYFAGRYVGIDELRAAFEVDSLPNPAGVGAAQPFVRSPVMRWLMIAGAIVAAINIALWIWAKSQSPDVIADIAVSPDLAVGEAYSEPFHVESGGLLEVKIKTQPGTPWSRAAVQFVPENDPSIDTARQRAAAAGKESELFRTMPGPVLGTAYSWGVEKLVRAPPTGRYRIHVDATLGAGFKPGSVNAASPTATADRAKIAAKVKGLTQEKRAVRVQVKGKVVRSGLFVFGALLCLVFPLIGFIRKRQFEVARWRPVLED